MTSYNDLEVTMNPPLAWITLQKPDKLNAISWSSMAEIEHAIGVAEEDDEIRAIVITGEGRGFCSGMDLTKAPPGGVANDAPEEAWFPRRESGRSAKMRSRHLYVERIYDCPKPVIAAVNGVAAGTGLSLALACDIRIASDQARFSAVFVKRATVADTGCTWLLPRLIGMERALRMLWTGRLVPAAEALAIGLVSEVVKADELHQRVEEIALEVANGPSLAIEMDKRLAHEGVFRTLHDQIEKEEYSMGVTNDSEDIREGRRSFREKRDARFVGR